MKIESNLQLQDLLLHRDEGAVALFGALEGWHRTWFDEYNRMKGWWSIDDDNLRLNEAYESLYRVTECPVQRRKLNLLIKPRGDLKRPIGCRETLAAVARKLEPRGFELLGCPSNSLTHAALWDQYCELMRRMPSAESRLFANRAFILLHRLVSEAELREFDKTLLIPFRDPLANIWLFLYDVLRTVLGRHWRDWELLKAYEVAMRFSALWVGRLERRYKHLPRRGYHSLHLCEDLALVGREDLAWRLFEALQPNRRYLRDSQVDDAFDETSKVLQVGRKRRPQGSTFRAVENLLAYGLITEASAEKQRARIEEKRKVRREERDREFLAMKALRRDADAAGIPEFIGDLTLKQYGVDANGDPQFKYGLELAGQQQAFYTALKAALLKGETPPLYGNDSYAHHFAQEMVEATTLDQQPSLVDMWARLVDAYEDNKSWSYICESYLLLLTINGRFAEVLDVISRISDPERLYVDIQFNAYRELALPIPGRLLLPFKSIDTDSYSRANPDLFVHSMDIVVNESGSINQMLFSRPRRGEFRNVEVFSVETYHIYHGHNANEVLGYKLFSVAERLKGMQPTINEWARNAMNRVREELGIPRIGEGWVSETELYRSLRCAFPDLSVLQHGRPEWLKPQHLDVWIPDLRVGVEFHGPQHFAPVEFFGGEDVFGQTVIRDERKKRLCSENDVTLLVITKTTEIPELIASIHETLSAVGPSGE